MGREAIAVANWKGDVAEIKALLESSGIILRGDIRAYIPRAEIAAFAVENDTLCVTAVSGVLELTMAAGEAEKWAKALAKPLPTLAEKLGIGRGKAAFVIGQADDPALADALSGAVTANAAEASCLIAVIISDADLDAAIALGMAHQHAPLWCVYGKGKFATVSDATIRMALRAQEFVDTKTSGVSDRLTATRYQLKKAG